MALAIALSGLLFLAAPATAASSTGSGVSYTLEGCRNNGDVTIPDAGGKVQCDDDQYTSGNLGKGWNELDLVPMRVTVKAGNSAPASQSFKFAIVVDNCSNGTGATGCATGRPGYDVLAADGANPPLNPDLSTGSCGTATWTGQQYAAPGVGGTGTSLYRVVSVTNQAKNSTCVYDSYARLALGSHLFPGSSLHFNLTDDALATGGVGARDVSIPVKEILPQDLTKSMSASQGTDYTWSVSKSGPARVDLGDTCATGEGSGSASITVTWTKSQGVGGMINVNTVVTAVNPASRAIDVSVSDDIYGNQTGTGTVLQTLTGSETVPANTSLPIIDQTFTVDPADAPGGFVSDRATATYTDQITGVPVPGTTSVFKAAAVTQGASGSGNSAVVTDDEWWSTPAAGVSFKATASNGSFTNYTPGDSVSGTTHVGWSSGTVTSSGSVTFTKPITSTQGNIGSAVLSDVATVTPAGGTPVNSDQLDIDVDVDTTVALQIRKTIPDDLQGSETATFDFTVTGPNAYSSPASVTFTAGQSDKLLTLLSGLEPGSYNISETKADHYVAQSDQQVTITGATDAGCTGNVRFDNTHALASAKATKVTVPAGSEGGWSFTLNGPNTPSGGETVVTDSSGVATFTTQLAEGSYTITETGQSGWDQTNATAGCSFTVNYPEDADAVFDDCAITNTQRGALKVHKTVNANDTGGTLVGTSFSICIKGPSYPVTADCKSVGIAGGDVTWTDLLPGTYTVSETNPGSPWIVDISPTSVTVNAGDTASVTGSTVTNTHKGRASVLKTVSAADGGGKAAPTGTDAYTFTLRQGATKYIGHPGSILDTKVANATNGGAFTFTPYLTPGNHYQVCETLPDTGWLVELGASQFVPEQFLLDDSLNPGVVNNVYCVDFVASVGPDPTVFTVNNRRPPGGSALTIGYWKNWASCTKSALKKKNSLDQNLYKYGADGMVVAADSGGWPTFGPTFDLRLFAGSNANVSTDCAKAVALLNKSTFTGTKKASDPAFNMAAQLVAAQLNYKAGAATTVTATINQAVLLLGKYNFNGNTHTTISAADKAIMNSLATTLDKYNNNVL